jgi:hypothetical protein
MRTGSDSALITNAFGIYLGTVNGFIREPVQISNNEIYTQTEASSRSHGGIAINDNCYTHVLFNSVYAKGRNNAALRVNSSSIRLMAKGNNLVADTLNYPITLNSSASYRDNAWDINYNNYYSPSFIGYVGGNITSMKAWRQQITGDIYSDSIKPDYLDVQSSLELSDYTGLEVPVIDEVRSDINGNIRSGMTTIGCYNENSLNNNGTLLDLIVSSDNLSVGMKDTAKLVLFNGGTTPISAADITLDFNGSQKLIQWTKGLAAGKSDTITLGEIIYASKNNTLSVWISDWKGFTDQYPQDDTISLERYVCDSSLNGTYTIGIAGNYQTIQDAVNDISTCGINGAVVFELQDNLYEEGVLIYKEIPGASNVNTVTFTSAATRAQPAIVQRAGNPNEKNDAIFILDNTSHIILSGLHLIGESPSQDANSSAKGIVFSNNCTNIEINNCRISNLVGASSLTDAAFSAIYKETTGKLDNVRIIDNVIEGGAYGIYLRGESANRNTNILIQKNTVTTDKGGMNIQYSSVEISENVITQYTRSSLADFIGLDLQNGAGDVLKNKVRSNRLSQGIYTYYWGGAGNKALLANNEIYGNSSMYESVGLYAGSGAYVNIYHNSVLIEGIASGTYYAFRIYWNSASVDVANNNFCVTSSGSSYAIHIDDNWNMRYYTINNNNYYNANGNVGYNGNGNRVTISDWKNAVLMDTGSISTAPLFMDTEENLNLDSDNGLLRPALSSITTDIDGTVRNQPLTTVGAYQFVPYSYNIAPQEITSPSFSASETVPVCLIIRNMGEETVTSMKIYWQINGVDSTPYTWNGSIVQGALSDTICIGELTPAAGYNNIKIWTSMPNNNADQRPQNDTIQTVTFGCDSMLSGTYIVGTGEDFETINDAVTALYACGVKGKVTIAIEDGVYNEIVRLSGEIAGTDDNNIVEFTSVSQNPQSVKIQRTDDGTLDIASFMLENTAHIKISYLELSGISPISNSHSYAKAIKLGNNCDDIEISNCRLIIPSVAGRTSYREYYSVVYMVDNAGNMSNIRITDNMIEGGDYGIYLRGGSEEIRNNDILIRNNTIDSVIKDGIYLYYSDNVDIINNKITQYERAQIYEFYGINAYHSSGNVINNRVKAYYATYGIYLYSHNNLYDYTPKSIANNEIIVDKLYTRSGGWAYSGLYLSYTKGDLAHNSVLTGNGSGAAVIIGGLAYPFSMNNNLFVALDSAAYGLSFTSDFSNGLPDFWNVNHNNYYAPKYFGQLANTGYNSMQTWSDIVLCDTNSVNIYPSFIDSAKHLQLSDYTGLTCPAVSTVDRDILNNFRAATTTMGAYVPESSAFDALLYRIINIPDYAAENQVLQPAVLFGNAGSTPLSSITIHSEFNGQPLTSKTWNSGTVNPSQSDTIFLDPITILQGQNSLVVWITDVNNTGLDMDVSNDTIRSDFFACDSLVHGDYIVGSSLTMEDIFEKIRNCGISGDVRLLYEEGTYTEPLILENLSDIMGRYHLTVTAVEGDNVIFTAKNSSDACITLYNTHNLTIKGITIDATNVTKGIIFNSTKRSSNITIDGCTILVDTLSTTTAYAGIYYDGQTSSSIRPENITIKNCYIKGGYYGVYMYGYSSVYPKGIIVDSNTIHAQHRYGIYLYYVDIQSVSCNKMTPRYRGYNNNWGGLYCNYTKGGNILANRIVSTNLALSYPTGIYVTNIESALIANNEVYIISNGSYPYGLNINYPVNVSILHNSVYVVGNGTTGSPYANYLYFSDASTNATIRNNVFVAEGGANAYAFYIGANATSYASNIAKYDIDANEMFSTGNIGYAQVLEQPTLQDWQRTIASDVSSVSIPPSFIDVSVNLNMADYEGMQCVRHDKVLVDIEGTPRTTGTTMGAYGVTLRDGYDLDLRMLVEPKTETELCSRDYVSVKYAIRNGGSLDYDFAADSLNLYFQMTGMLSFDTLITIKSGSLNVYMTDTIDVVDFLPVYFAGDYQFRAWIEQAKDTVHSNDTLTSRYHNKKIALPYDQEFFNADLFGLVSDTLVGVDKWEVVYAGNDTIIEPAMGGKIIFDAPLGKMSRLRTGQLELNRTSQPKLEFWYAHDDGNPTQRDMMDVKISFNGDNNFNNVLPTIERYNPTYTTPTWVKYEIDLSPYVDSSCVIVAFDATSFGGIQHIDRILITSNQNLALDSMIIPELSVCDLKKKTVQIIISNTTGQGVDFTQTPANVCVDIKAQTTQTLTFPLTGTMEGLESDTLEFDLSFEKGKYDIKAYINTNVADFNRNDDTVSTIIDISPAFAIDIHKLSKGGLAYAGLEVKQGITITNIGNMELSDIGLILTVQSTSGESYSFTATDTSKRILNPEDTVHFYFADLYTVPWSYDYDVTVYGYLICDSAMVDTIASIPENVDITDLYIVDISKPIVSGTPDNVGDSIAVSVEIQNRNIGRDYHNEVYAVVLITDTNGKEQQKIREEIPQLLGGKQTTYDFTGKYVVPKMKKYHLTVYIESIDNYEYNDTMRKERQTNYTVSVFNLEGVSFTLEQNIPNPANNKTVIKYNIPQDGEITFAVYSVNGQLLYSQKENAISGDNQIELNISDYASGIYFYTMEYKGQRLTKQMSITR